MAKNEIITVDQQRTELANALEKTKKKKVIRSMADKDFISTDVKFFSTGELGLDIALGGGWPIGRIIKLAGKKGCGKSTLLAKALVIFTRVYKKHVFLMDMENAWTAKWLKKLGADMNLIHFAVPESLEEGLDILEATYSSRTYDLIIFDSLSSASPNDEIELSNEEWNAQALKARVANKFFRKIQGRQSRLISIGLEPPTFMFANHIFVNPHDRFNKDTTPGGLHQDNASSVIVNLLKTAWIKDKGDASTEDDDKPTFGFYTFAKIPHSKTSPPNRSWKIGLISEDFLGHEQFDFFHGYSIATIAQKLGIIQQSGTWYKYTEELKFQGSSNLYEAILLDEKFADDLVNEIKRRLKIISKDPNLDIKFEAKFMHFGKTNISQKDKKELEKMETELTSIQDQIPEKKAKPKKAAKKKKKVI